MDKNTIDLKIKLLQAGVKQKDVAKKANVDKSLVSHVIAGRLKSARVLNVIREMIGDLNGK